MVELECGESIGYGGVDLNVWGVFSAFGALLFVVGFVHENKIDPFFSGMMTVKLIQPDRQQVIIWRELKPTLLNFDESECWHLWNVEKQLSRLNSKVLQLKIGLNPKFEIWAQSEIIS